VVARREGRQTLCDARSELTEAPRVCLTVRISTDIRINPKESQQPTEVDCTR